MNAAHVTRPLWHGPGSTRTLAAAQNERDWAFDVKQKVKRKPKRRKRKVKK